MSAQRKSGDARSDRSRAQGAAIGREFMDRTRYVHLGPSDQQRGLPQPPLAAGRGETDEVIDLPHPSGVQVGRVDLREAIESRVSVRRYAPGALTTSELSYLLWCTQGVKRVQGGYVTLRTVPSAGARHALETYLLVNRVQGLQPGLYRYLALEHKLAEVALSPDIAERVTEACWGQQFVRSSAVTFAWVAVAYRMTWRYGQRGYRYLHLDAGHVCQNLYLAAQAVQCGVCGIGAFSDEALNPLLGLDGEEEFVIYLATVGKEG